MIDEAINYFRANVLFRKYDVKGACGVCAPALPTRAHLLSHAGASDKLLIYLTLYISACLRKLEGANNPAAGQKARSIDARQPAPVADACTHRRCTH